MASEVDIANRALSLLSAAHIVALTDDSPNARKVNLAYPIVRDSELQAHPWQFARVQVQLAADLVAPLFDYSSAFTLPADCLRILPYPNADWTEHNGKIYTNDSAPLNLTYVKRETDTAKFHAAFVAALAAKIASELCFEVTESNTRDAALEAKYKDAIRLARRTSAFAAPSNDMPEDDWITTRGGGTSYRKLLPYSN